MERVPVTVIGGYLGAGKTTLLNRLLADPGGRRLGVIVNDFGELAIDAELLAGVGHGDVVSLPNGCVCCTLGADLHQALATMMAAPTPPDHVVIEASGVADPAVAAAWGTVPPFRPGGVFVLAAADSVRTTARDRYVGGEVTRQLAGADLILVTRADLCGDDELVRVHRWLDDTYPSVPRLPVTDGDVPADVVLGTRPERVADPVVNGVHRLDDLYERQEWAATEPASAELLGRFLDRLPSGVVRAKGVVALDDGSGVEVQVVGRAVTTMARDAPARSQLVVIARRGTPSCEFDLLS